MSRRSDGAFGLDTDLGMNLLEKPAPNCHWWSSEGSGADERKRKRGKMAVESYMLEGRSWAAARARRNPLDAHRLGTPFDLLPFRSSCPAKLKRETSLASRVAPLRSAGLELRAMRARSAAAHAARVRLPTHLGRRSLATSSSQQAPQAAIKPAEEEPYRPSVRQLKLEGQAIVTEGACLRCVGWSP